MTKPHRADKMLKLAGVCRIAKVPEATAAQRLDRGIWKMSRRDTHSQGSGQHKEFCRDTTIRFAISQKLIELNVGAKPASEAASLFDQPQPGRNAGDVFEFGRTLLIKKAGGSRVVNVGYDDSLIDILGRPFEAAIIVDIGQIARAVDSELANITT
jgi:hypothetical protein